MTEFLLFELEILGLVAAALGETLLKCVGSVWFNCGGGVTDVIDFTASPITQTSPSFPHNLNNTIMRFCGGERVQSGGCWRKGETRWVMEDLYWLLSEPSSIMGSLIGSPSPSLLHSQLES